MLRKPVTGPGQLGPCFCPPGECMAPVIMGVQTPCIRRREHVASADCWCQPEVHYVDPDTDAKVYVHRRPQ